MWRQADNSAASHVLTRIEGLETKAAKRKRVSWGLWSRCALWTMLQHCLKQSCGRRWCDKPLLTSQTKVMLQHHAMHITHCTPNTDASPLLPMPCCRLPRTYLLVQILQPLQQGGFEQHRAMSVGLKVDADVKHLGLVVKVLHTWSADMQGNTNDM